jgi:hypothetical protein
MGEIIGLGFGSNLAVRVTSFGWLWSWFSLDLNANIETCSDFITSSLCVGYLVRELALVVEQVVFSDVVPQIETQSMLRSTVSEIK